MAAGASMLIDTHCHLDFPDFAGDVAGLVARAKAAGVTRMVTISTRVAKFPVYAALAEAHPEIWCTVGTHPHQAGERDGIPAEELVQLSAHPRCVGIGEAGLDYFYDKAPRDAQARVGFAPISPPRAKRGCRSSFIRAMRMRTWRPFSPRNADGSLSAILHCFSSGASAGRVRRRDGLFHFVLRHPDLQGIRGVARHCPATCRSEG